MHDLVTHRAPAGAVASSTHEARPVPQEATLPIALRSTPLQACAVTSMPTSTDRALNRLGKHDRQSLLEVLQCALP